MRAQILKAVAAPKQFLWTPFELGAANISLQLTFMVMYIGITSSNPMYFIVSIILGHVLLAVYGAREPHLASLLKAFGRYHHQSHNMYSCKGTKLVS